MRNIIFIYSIKSDHYEICEKAFILRKRFLSLRLVVARMKMCVVINGYSGLTVV